MISNHILDAAVDYVKQGYSVIPLHGKIPPKGFAWKPYQERKAGSVEVEAYFADYPELTGIGIVTGKISGLTVLDFDLMSHGEETYQKLRAEHGDFPKTPTVITGGGGRHLYFKYRGVGISSKVGILPGLDIRSDGGYVVAPPSVHASGRKYYWKNGCSLDEIELADMPEWLIDLLTTDKAAHKGQVAGKISEGRRNTTLHKYASGLRGKGLYEDDIRLLVHAKNERDCSPMLPDAEVEQIIKSVSGYHTQEMEDTTLSAAEIFDKELKPMRWIVKAMIPEGLILLAGPAKTGKSYLALQTALGVVLNQPVMNHAVESGEVWYADL
jgi:hypothetical protein